MAAIRGGHTRPEMQIRRAMHAAGLRYRLHVRNLPGKPDLVFPKFRAAIFVNGCFWHGHDCQLFRWPVTRKEFWEAKIERNVANDDRALTALLQDGWRVATVWECALKGKTRLDPQDAMKTLADWVKSDADVLTVRGI